MSSHDHNASVERDPVAAPTAYVMLWGFVLLFASMLGLQYLAWAQQEEENKAKASTTQATQGEVQREVARQRQALEAGPTTRKPIGAAMKQVVGQYSNPH